MVGDVACVGNQSFDNGDRRRYEYCASTTGVWLSFVSRPLRLDPLEQVGDALPDWWCVARSIQDHPRAVGVEVAESNRIRPVIEGMIAAGVSVEDILEAFVSCGELVPLDQLHPVQARLLRMLGSHALKFASNPSTEDRVFG